jgi:GTPase
MGGPNGGDGGNGGDVWLVADHNVSSLSRSATTRTGGPDGKHGKGKDSTAAAGRTCW